MLLYLAVCFVNAVAARPTAAPAAPFSAEAGRPQDATPPAKYIVEMVIDTPLSHINATFELLFAERMSALLQVIVYIDAVSATSSTALPPAGPSTTLGLGRSAGAATESAIVTSATAALNYEMSPTQEPPRPTPSAADSGGPTRAQPMHTYTPQHGNDHSNRCMCQCYDDHGRNWASCNGTETFVEGEPCSCSACPKKTAPGLQQLCKWVWQNASGMENASSNAPDDATPTPLLRLRRGATEPSYSAIQYHARNRTTYQLISAQDLIAMMAAVPPTNLTAAAGAPVVSYAAYNPSQGAQGGGLSTLVIAIIAAVGGVLLIAAAVGVIVMERKRKLGNAEFPAAQSHDPAPSLELEPESTPAAAAPEANPSIRTRSERSGSTGTTSSDSSHGGNTVLMSSGETAKRARIQPGGVATPPMSDADSCHEANFVHMWAKRDQADLIAEMLVHLKKQGQLDTLRDLTHACDANGHTPWLVACNAGHLMSAQALWAHGGADDVAATYDGAGETVLHRAVRNGHMDLVKWLISISCGASAITVDGSTPLHVAAACNRVEAARLLCEQADASHSAADAAGCTPLMVAAKLGCNAVLAFLVALPNACLSLSDANGYTALHWCAASGNVEGTQLLLKHNAPRNALTPKGHTPLHLAAREGHAAMVKVLLAAGVQRRALDDEGRTAADLATQNGHPDVARIFAVRSAQPLQMIAMRPLAAESGAAVEPVSTQMSAAPTRIAGASATQAKRLSAGSSQSSPATCDSPSVTSDEHYFSPHAADFVRVDVAPLPEDGAIVSADAADAADVPVAHAPGYPLCADACPPSLLNESSNSGALRGLASIDEILMTQDLVRYVLDGPGDGFSAQGGM